MFVSLQVTIPQAPMSFSPSTSINERLEKIQNYMNMLQYPLNEFRNISQKKQYVGYIVRVIYRLFIKG